MSKVQFVLIHSGINLISTILSFYTNLLELSGPVTHNGFGPRDRLGTGIMDAQAAGGGYCEVEYSM